MAPSLGRLPDGWQREADGRLRVPPLFAIDGSVDPTAEQRFWTDGYVPWRLPDDRIVVEARERVGRLRPRDRFDPSTIGNSRGTYHCTFLDTDTDYRREVDRLVREVFAEPLALAMPGFVIATGNIYVKPPGTGRFEVHQNWPIIDNMDVPTLTAWIPLQDADAHNGTIRIVPGSHRVFPDIEAATSERFFDGFEDDLVESRLTPIDVKAGEVLFFDDNLVHWSGENRSTTPRIAFQIALIPKGSRHVLWVRDPDDPRWFELWDIDPEFWMTMPIQGVLSRPVGLPLADRRPNPNTRLTLAEFDGVLARALELRRRRYVFADGVMTGRS